MAGGACGVIAVIFIALAERSNAQPKRNLRATTRLTEAYVLKSLLSFTSKENSNEKNTPQCHFLSFSLSPSTFEQIARAQGISLKPMDREHHRDSALVDVL